MHALLLPVGSHGDVLPLIAVGRTLAARGHRVTMVGSAWFAEETAEAGLELVSISTVEEYRAMTADPALTHPYKGIRVVASALEQTYRRVYDTVGALLQPDTILVGSTLAWGAQLLRETQGARMVSLHMAPGVLRSSYEMPQLGPGTPPSWAPRVLKQAWWALVDRVAADPVFASGLNRFRHELGLPPVRRVMHDWMFRVEASVGLFPDWYANPQPDWPANLVTTGFPLYDGATETLSPEVEAFLAAGPPPVVFTFGTAFSQAGRVYTAAAEACRKTGCRGMLLTAHAQNVPRQLPEGVVHFPYVPLTLLLPRVAAIAHHGGIGTTSQALRAGVPQLIYAMAFDQFDNAHRVARLGVGLDLHSRLQALAPGVRRVLSDPVMADCARAWGARLRTEGDGLEATCRVIESAA